VFQLSQRALIHIFPVFSVEAGSNSSNPALLRPPQTVFNAAGHDDEFRLPRSILARGIPCGSGLHHQEHLIFILVVMEDELTLSCRASQLAVQLGGNVGFQYSEILANCRLC